MAKHGGYGGFGGMGGMNMNQLMKQAQQMQRKMEEQQAQLEQQEFTASAGGAVTVKMSGKRELLSVELKEEVVDPEDIEMLQDLIVAAVNEAIKKVDSASASNMQSLTGGMGGLF